MKLLIALAGLILLLGANAQKDVDVEGLRGILQSLLSNGQPVTSESLSVVAQSFSGVEKEVLTRYTNQLADAKEAEEFYIHDEILDVATFRNLLFNLKALGVTIRPNIAEALLGVIDNPTKSALAPIVAGWKKDNAVSLTDSLKSSLDDTITAMTQVIQGTTDTVSQRLKAKIASLPEGIAKSMLIGLEEDLQMISQQQGGTFSFTDQPDAPMSAEVIKSSINQLNKILDREVVQFLSASFLTLRKDEVKKQVEILMTKVYDNVMLPAVLEAVHQSLV